MPGTTEALHEAGCSANTRAVQVIAELILGIEQIVDTVHDDIYRSLKPVAVLVLGLRGERIVRLVDVIVR